MTGTENDAAITNMMRMIEQPDETTDTAMTPGDMRKSELPVPTSAVELSKKREKNRVAAAASRARKKEYVQNLEKAIHVLTTEKLELQVKVATLTNQLWEQSIKIDDLEKQLAEAKGHRVKDEGAPGEMVSMAQFPAVGDEGVASQGATQPPSPSQQAPQPSLPTQPPSPSQPQASAAAAAGAAAAAASHAAAAALLGAGQPRN